MSRKEARRPGLVQAALAGKITTAEGARALEMSRRQFRRLKAQYRAEGVRGLVHRGRGAASPRRLDEAIRARVADLVQTTYRDFNDCHATEQLCELEGLPVSRSTVRRLRRALGLAPKHRRRPPQHRARRPRRSRPGALVLIDGSEFDWLGTGARVLLLGAIDDATSTVVALHFRPAEDLHGYLTLVSCKFSRKARQIFSRKMRHLLGHRLRGGLSHPRREGGCYQPWHAARFGSTSSRGSSTPTSPSWLAVTGTPWPGCSASRRRRGAGPDGRRWMGSARSS